jgi:hypothetical protein
MKAHTVHAVDVLMKSIAGDTPTLLSVVAGGEMCWRNHCLSVCRGLAVDERIADGLFAFFADQVVRRFGRERSAGQLLDSLEVSSPPSQREIDHAWEVESSSSEEGRRFFYGPDGHPEDLIRQMVN